MFEGIIGSLMGTVGMDLLGDFLGDDEPAARPGDQSSYIEGHPPNVNSAQSADDYYDFRPPEDSGIRSDVAMPGADENGLFSAGKESEFPTMKVIDTAIRGAGALAPFATGAAGYAGQAETNRTMKEIADAANAFNAQQAKDAFERSAAFNSEQAALGREFSASQSSIGRDFSASQASIGRDFSASQAQKAMDFSERMSNTQWQRAVADMSAAGLNPMLAFMKGPASSPSGFAGSSPIGSSSVGSAPTASASSGYATASIPQVGNKMAAAINSGATGAGVMKSLEEMERIIADTVKTLEADIPYVKGQTDLSREQRKRIEFEIAKIEADTRLSDAQKGRVIVDTVLRELDVPGAQNRAASEDTWWGRNIRPYLKDFFGGSSAASHLRSATR